MINGFIVFFAFSVAIIIMYAVVSIFEEKQTDNTVRLPKFYGIAGVVCLIGFLGIITMYFLTSDEYTFAFLFEFSIFVAMCVIIILAYLNWRIKYDDDDTFVYRTMFRHTLKIKYSDVIKTRSVRTGDLLIKANKRWLVIDREAIGKDNFRNKLYMILGKRKAKSKKKKKRLRKSW